MRILTGFLVTLNLLALLFGAFCFGTYFNPVIQTERVVERPSRSSCLLDPEATVDDVVELLLGLDDKTFDAFVQAFLLEVGERAES